MSFIKLYPINWGFPGGAAVKNPSAKAEGVRDEFNPWGGKIPWSRKWQPTTEHAHAHMQQMAKGQ